MSQSEDETPPPSHRADEQGEIHGQLATREALSAASLERLDGFWGTDAAYHLRGTSAAGESAWYRLAGSARVFEGPPVREAPPDAAAERRAGWRICVLNDPASRRAWLFGSRRLRNTATPAHGVPRVASATSE